MYNYNNYLSNDYFRNTTPGMNNNNQVDLYNPKEGYEKGNMFADLYEQYKNYQPKKLTAANEKENLLLEIGMYCFGAHDLRLYLDLNPNDSSMLALFNDYNSRANNLIREYESKYGAIMSNSEVNESTFSWAQGNFPWEGGIN